jgi:hypothetical protein
VRIALAILTFAQYAYACFEFASTSATADSAILFRAITLPYRMHFPQCGHTLPCLLSRFGIVERDWHLCGLRLVTRDGPVRWLLRRVARVYDDLRRLSYRHLLSLLRLNHSVRPRFGIGGETGLLPAS